MASPALASTAVEEGALAVDWMFGEAVDSSGGGSSEFPTGIWTIPEIAFFGASGQTGSRGWDIHGSNLEIRQH